MTRSPTETYGFAPGSGARRTCPTIGDFTSRTVGFGGSAPRRRFVRDGRASLPAGVRATEPPRAASAASAPGAATCTAPRCCGLFEMRIFIPLSDEISIESTVDSSMHVDQLLHVA